jgi:hypothetical protein
MPAMDLRAAFGLMVFVVVLPLASSIGLDTEVRCRAARGRLDQLRTDLFAAEAEVEQLCGPDELIPSHATLLQLDREFRELRATSALDEAKLAELHSMVHRLIGLARGLGAVSRPDVQQPGQQQPLPFSVGSVGSVHRDSVTEMSHTRR